MVVAQDYTNPSVGRPGQGNTVFNNDGKIHWGQGRMTLYIKDNVICIYSKPY